MNYLYIFIDISKLRGTKVPRGRNRPLASPYRLASFGPDGTSLTQLKYYLQCVGEATLMGAEGDCALVRCEGPYNFI